MEKEFVTYEQALALKELGFDEKCFALYNREKVLRLNNINNPSDRTKSFKVPKDVSSYPAPLIQQAFRFFREKYGLSYYIVSFFIEGQFECWIQSSGNIGGASVCIDTKNTYEEAEQACLNKLIEIAKESK